VFAAVLIRGQTNLLPTSRARLEIRNITEPYPDSYFLTDEFVVERLAACSAGQRLSIPNIGQDHVAAIVFTSGSTGRSQPHPKPWGSLVHGARLAQRRFGFGNISGSTIVATVPPQHLYGLETSIMVPLVTPVSIHSGRPFFPEDIRAALAAIPSPRILITTPIHLRVCAQAHFAWPPVDMIISATAPLSTALAVQAEQAFSAAVFEIYGCTEAGSIGSRRTVDGNRWRLYNGLRMDEDIIQGGHVPAPVQLNDIVERDADGSFKLLGRRQDLVNIAGKRTSLSYLNHKLHEIEGIEDGAFVMPEGTEEATTRLAALVVAPQLSEQAIMAALAERIDPVFLPRPLYKVERLPRNDVGKLPRAAVLDLIETLRRPEGGPR
jgi:acyl-coenzyme A synthetase/AMP-(fatty) acid ligase